MRSLAVHLLREVDLGHIMQVTSFQHHCRVQDPNAKNTQRTYPDTVSNTRQVQDYIAKGGDVNKPDREHCSPLMWACWGGHVEIVKRLLEEGAK